MAFIDLGEVGGVPEVEEHPPNPRRRRWIAVLVGAVLLVGLGAAAPVPPGLVETVVPAELGDAIDVSGSQLFVVHPPNGNHALPGDRVITAYDVPSGRRLWQTRSSSVRQEFGGVIVLSGAVVLPRYEDGSGGGSRVVVLDARTGRQRWERAGSLTGWTTASPGAAARMLLSIDAPPDAQGLPPTASERIMAVDMVTGATAWSYEPPPQAQVLTAWRASDGHSDALVIGLPSGRVEVRSTVTARLTAAANLRPPLEPERDVTADPILDRQWITVAEDMLMVVGPGSRTLAAYGIDRLDRRWEVPWERDLGWFGYPLCGSLLCMQTRDGRVQAVDPRTGRTRWEQSWSYLEAAGPLLLASRGDGPYGGEGRLAFVDPATGRSVAELGVWAVAGYASALDDKVLFKHDPGTGRAWVGLADARARDVRLLGVAHEVSGDCRVGRDSLVCRRRDATIGIWRYR
jgi:outer membrane protein assembly factor BamB